jgi:hypothetical protein
LSTGPNSANGQNTDAFYIQPDLQKSSYPGWTISDSGAEFILEMQGIVSVDAIQYVSGCSYTSSGITVPITGPSSQSAVGVLMIHPPTAVDKWGTLPTGVSNINLSNGQSLALTVSGVLRPLLRAVDRYAACPAVLAHGISSSIRD